MTVSTRKSSVNRLLLVATTISAIFLLAAACAQGEAIDDAVAPVASETEEAISTGEAPVPAGPEAPAEISEPDESATEVVGGMVEVASTTIESNPGTSTASAASKTVREATSEAVGATSETVRRAADAVGQVATETTTAVDNPAQHLSGLSEEVGTKVAAVAGHGDPARPSKLMRPAGTPSSGMLSSSGESPAPESPASVDTAPHTHGAVQPVGALPRVPIGGMSSSSAQYRGYSSAEPQWPRGLAGLNGIRSTPMSGDIGVRSNDPAPLDGPVPSPGSSGAGAGSTGSSFIPLAALLALLALAVSAALRRFGEAPDFRPPTPFVCALERPG
ncbi:MAG TPA: hypothetical protein VF093_04055 [Solirubrobacterales bacterium]